MKIGKMPKNIISERRKIRTSENYPACEDRQPTLKPDKGLKRGSCNRIACQMPNACWFNHSTQKYYCRRCAEDLNLANRFDAVRLYGHDLCTEEK